MIGTLNFNLVLNVRETTMVNSLLSLVCDSVKRVSELMHRLNFLEINLSQAHDDTIIAKVSVERDSEIFTETCESRMWDVAFLNALEKVQEKSKGDLVA